MLNFQLSICINKKRQQDRGNDVGGSVDSDTGHVRVFFYFVPCCG